MNEVAVVGVGRWGKNLVRNFYELGALYGAYDIETDYQDIINNNEIKGVAIATPNSLHFTMAKEALLAGKDVFVEKPMTMNVEEAEKLVRLAEENQRILMVGHLMLYHPSVIELKGQPIKSIHCKRAKKREFRDLLWSLAPHDVSIILYLLEEFPQKIRATQENSHILINMQFETANASILLDSKAPKETTLIIDDETVDFNNTIEPLFLECQDFVDCIKTRGQPKANGKSGLEVTKVIWDCQKFMRQAS